MANDAEGGGPPKALGWVTVKFWKGDMRANTLGGKHQGKAPQGQVEVHAEWTEHFYEPGSQQTYLEMLHRT